MSKQTTATNEAVQNPSLLMENLSEVLAAVSALAALGTFFVAIWVFFAANRIRRVEQLSFHYQLWHDLHNMQINSGFLDKWKSEFYSLKFDEERFDGTDDVVTFSFLNMIRVSWVMCMEGVLHRSAQQEEVFNYIFLLKEKKDFLVTHAIRAGYDPAFCILLETVMTEDREDGIKFFHESLKSGWVERIKRENPTKVANIRRFRSASDNVSGIPDQQQDKSEANKKMKQDVDRKTSEPEPDASLLTTDTTNRVSRNM